MKTTERPVRRLGCTAACAAFLLLAGCATRAMPTPLPYRAGGPLAAETALLDRDDVRAAAPDGADPADRPARFPVLYATNRRPKGPADAPTGYTSRRGLTTWLGAAFVRFGGDADTAGDVVAGLARNGRPRLRVEDLESYGVSWRTIPLSDRRAFEVWDEDGPPVELRAPEERFLEELGRRLGEGGNVLVYVPGFNTPFEGRRCASRRSSRSIWARTPRRSRSRGPPARTPSATRSR